VQQLARQARLLTVHRRGKYGPQVSNAIIIVAETGPKYEHKEIGYIRAKIISLLKQGSNKTAVLIDTVKSSRWVWLGD
jgi:hypothetical protein